MNFNVDARIDPHMREALTALDGRAPLLAGMVRYHLGFVDQTFAPVAPHAVDRGKRIRPAVAMLAAGATGGDPSVAAPLAAAIELLHNFTLIHDDIQDESATRRHRPTVWSIWGAKQAINAGDALFAVAHLPLFHLTTAGVSPTLALRLADAFDRMTIAIVDGQTLDLGFEGRATVTSPEYVAMIAGKTAAIVRFAAWGGALLAGACDETAAHWADFGLALGLGFQIQDDLLGIWGDAAATGKPAADDIRRRKKSLPIIMLGERLDPATRAELDDLYAAEPITEPGVARILALLAASGVRRDVEREIARFHGQAATALRQAAPEDANLYRQRLLTLVEQLSTRHA